MPSEARVQTGSWRQRERGRTRYRACARSAGGISSASKALTRDGGIPLKPRLVAICISAALVPCLVLAMAASALAADHRQILIHEVFPGSTADGANAEFVELQMYAPDQNAIANKSQLRFYAQNGNFIVSESFLSNVANGENQRTVLGADSSASLMPDKTFVGSGSRMDPLGGAVCYFSTELSQNLDCVACGSFNDPTPGDGATDVGDASLAIPDGSSITRSIGAGCPTLLESSDDTNDSLADFDATAPTPRNNV